MSADNSGYTLLSEYNDLNKPTKTTYPDGSFQQIDWACCMVERVVDREGRATHFRYDGLKRLVEKEQPGGHVTKYGYDARDSLTRLEDNAGNVTTWLYDYASPQQTVTKTYATGLTEVSNFNTNGTVKDFTDRMGRTTSYAYDQNLNLTTVTPSGLPVVSYTHDSYDRVATRTDGVGLTAFGYDIRSLLASVDGPWDNDVVTFSYDDGGRAVGQSIDGVVSGLTYDTLGRVGTSTSALGTFTNTYVGDSGRLAQVLYPNNQVSGLTWQNAGGDFRLSQIENLKVYEYMGSHPM